MAPTSVTDVRIQREFLVFARLRRPLLGVSGTISSYDLYSDPTYGLLEPSARHEEVPRSHVRRGTRQHQGTAAQHSSL